MNQQPHNNNTREWSFTEMALNGIKNFGIVSNGDITILKKKIQNLTEEEKILLLTNNSRIGKTFLTLDEYIDSELLTKKFEQNN
jgi:hypothetical protein